MHICIDTHNCELVKFYCSDESCVVVEVKCNVSNLQELPIVEILLGKKLKGIIWFRGCVSAHILLCSFLVIVGLECVGTCDGILDLLEEHPYCD